MGNGYTSGKLDDEDRQRALFGGILRRLAALEAPNGTSINSLVAQVQLAIANITTTVNAAIAANSYTKAQIDSKIASPGAIAPTTVSASGSISGTTLNTSSDVTVGGKLFDPDGATFNITGTRVTTWMETATGRFGNTASSRRYKQDIADAGLDMLAVLKVVPYRFHYIDEIRKRDDPTFDGYVGPQYQVAVEYGFMAEDLAAAGLNQWVYLDADGQPDSVNYVMWVVALQAVIRAQAVHIRNLESDMAAVKAKLGL